MRLLIKARKYLAESICPELQERHCWSHFALNYGTNIDDNSANSSVISSQLWEILQRLFLLNKPQEPGEPDSQLL